MIFKFGKKLQYKADDINQMYGFWGTLDIHMDVEEIEEIWNGDKEKEKLKKVGNLRNLKRLRDVIKVSFLFLILLNVILQLIFS
mgnify:CR=1 FL=1